MSFMLAGILGALFVALLVFFGWLLAIRVLKVESLPAALGGGFVFGPAAYLVLTNALGYILPIQWAFRGGVIALAGMCVVLGMPMILARQSLFPALDKPHRFVTWMLWGLGLLGGLATARFLTSDPWVWSYLPLASTMQAGNFPVVEPTNPWAIAGYHYGPQLFAAAFSSLTGLSLAAGFNVQPFFGALGGLFFASALVYGIVRSWKGALLAPVLAFLAGSFAWLNGIFLVRDLIDHFIMGNTVAVPFQWLAPVFANVANPSMLVIFGSRSYTFGFPFVFGMLFALQQSFAHTPRRQTIAWIVVAVFLSLALALCAETIFVLLLPALFAYVVMIRFFLYDSAASSRSRLQRIALIGFAVFLPATLLAVFQGGLLTTTFFDPRHGGSPMYFSFDGRIRIDSPGATLAFWEPIFWMKLGLPFFFIPIAAIYWWKKRNEHPFAMFVVFLALLHLLVPFTVRYINEENQFLRLLHTGLSLVSFLTGLMLSRTWMVSTQGWKRWLSRIAVVCMVLSAGAYIVVRLILPNMRLEPDAPLFAPMPAITQEQAELYAWVREHTTLDDYFYLRTVKGHPNYLPEKVALQPDRILFMANTGRYAVGFLMWGNYTQDIRDAGDAIEDRCDSAGFRTLNVRYLLVEDVERAAWFDRVCTESDWEARYGDPAAGYPVIYEWKNRGR